MLKSHVANLKGRSVAVTGRCWVARSVLVRRVRKQGGSINKDGDVTATTDLFVRGDSEHWAYVDYGLKEAAIARRLKAGQDIDVVDADQFQQLVETGRRAVCSTSLAGEAIEWLRPDPGDARFREITRIEGPLDREYTVLGRTEQAILRNRLFGASATRCCDLCGSLFPRQLLIAAHIKPRAHCSLAERRDASSIVFGLCVLGCDALYERGLASVEDDGRIVVARVPPTSDRLRALLKSLKGRRCPSWRPGTAGYFRWHLRRQFRGSGRAET